MSDVLDLLVTTLSTLNYPVKEQGSYSDDEELPESFIMYQDLGSEDSKHYDNEPSKATYEYQVTVYSRRATVKLEADTKLREILVPAGFMRRGGRQLPLNRETGQHAYTSTYRYHDSI